jgi:peptide chain release factor 3
MDADEQRKLAEDMEMLDQAGAKFSPADVLAGRITPVFFGSARNNFGVQLLLDGFLKYAESPRPRTSNGVVIPVNTNVFSGFIFKIQANMDPRHRDRIAFLRVCSGIFSRDMTAVHPRSGKTIRLSNAAKLFGRDRETVDEAYAGDIVGFVGQSLLGIGDTLTEDPGIVYDEIPRFPPECFSLLSNPNPSKFKRFREGVDQLLREGVVQGFQPRHSSTQIPILAAVGPLQFEVFQYRLESEYGAEVRLEQAEWNFARWVHPSVDVQALTPEALPTGAILANDAQGQPVILFPGEWALNLFVQKNPSVLLGLLPFENGVEKG